MKKLLILITLVIVAGVSFVVFDQYYLNQRVGVSAPFVFEISKGSSLTGIANNLEKQSVIRMPRVFVKLGQIHGFDDKIKYGEYLVEPTDTYRGLFEKFVSGLNYKYEVTLVEGDHMYKYAQQLEDLGLCGKQEFLQRAKDKGLIQKLLGETQDSLEGYLFPETYHFSKVDGVEVIIQTLVNKFLQETKDFNWTQSGLTRHQAVTLASIVEKETGVGYERPQISSVFYNRMKKGMKLQTDPTILYGILHATGKETNNITKKDLQTPTAYNTYVISGLPPGPIGNPGIESLRAALNPDETPYLYFVSQNDGTHVFTTTYQDHLKAVKKFQLNPAMRKGRSWRDYKKKKKGEK